MRFSANLGFLFTDRDLVAAIHAAAKHGFEAVECHFPYETPAEDVATALRETGLEMLGLNTAPGDMAAGDFGLAALTGREAEARAAIDQAIAYADAIKARAVHVMAGKTDGSESADATFRANLNYACTRAAPYGITILIEPINTRDVPDYHLSTTDHAERLINAVAQPNLRLMFDCYHLQTMQGDLLATLKRLLPLIGHIQIASVPDRAEPDHGEVNYPDLLRHIAALGYDQAIGAEYRPAKTTEDGLGWREACR